MNIEWNVIFGIIAIITGLYWIIKRSVPIGIEGKKPSFYAKDNWAILLGIIAIIIGLFFVTNIPKQVQIDECLDKGGSYNYGSNTCDYGQRKTPYNKSFNILIRKDRQPNAEDALKSNLSGVIVKHLP